MDVLYMNHAMDLAMYAYNCNEVPVGAIVVYQHKIIGKGYNQKENLNNPLAHAEIIAISSASQFLGQWRLNKCTIYVTLEPCMMCFGAIENARIKRLVFAASCQNNNILMYKYFKYCYIICSGIMKRESYRLLSIFFQNVRKC